MGYQKELSVFEAKIKQLEQEKTALKEDLENMDILMQEVEKLQADVTERDHELKQWKSQQRDTQMLSNR